ncbi:MAG TPA: response regulator [Myxococcales bacterium]|jgi:DNA-binding response OmpR family regulator|nr:response regulator [Myxococcales bacterium]
MSKAPNVTIVDANPAEQALLRYVLSKRGISSTALSPRAGLEAIAATAPDLVLLDVGRDLAGVELCRTLQRRVPGAAIVLLSDLPEPQLRAAVGVLSVVGVVTRPLSRESIERALEAVTDRERSGSGRKRVLIIDDDEDVLRVVSKILGNAGCQVTCVTDPRDINALSRTDYDVVLLDVVMPEIDGLTVCQALRRSVGDDLRICMISAAHDPESVRKASLYGADGFLTKPIRSQELLALVGRARLDPGASASAASEPAAPVKAATPRRQRHVLVVDDDKDILEYVRAVYRREGVHVDAIQDPSQLRESLPPGGSYDLVLLDIFMPAVDGIELLRRFSSDVKNVASRFYIITAEEDAALRTLAHRSGADGYLTKPLQQRALLELLPA